MIRNILKRRILSAILMASMLFGVAFLTAFTCQPANARCCTAFQKVYYSDATYSIVIGEFWARSAPGDSRTHTTAARRASFRTAASDILVARSSDDAEIRHPACAG